MAIIRLQGDAERRAGIYYEVDTDLPALGAGGMGQVYRGTRVDSNGQTCPVAIKFLFSDLPESAVERSRREASIQIHNENLVEMYGFIEIRDNSGQPHYHVVSELLEGVMLFDLLEGKTSDKLGNEVAYAAELYRLFQNDREAFATKVVKAVLSGVMAMHDRGYIHRDIDPSNIMVTRDGKIKLIDYGIAKNLRADQTNEHHLTSTGQFMGKAAYAAPELITGDVAHQNETTDIYAIGIMLFQLLTGHCPFEGANHEVLEQHMHKLLPVKEIANKQMRNVVDRATRKRQGERYMSAAEFRVDIERAERGQKTMPATKVTVSTTSAVPKWAYIAAAAVVVVVAVGVTLILSDRGDDGALAAAGEATEQTVADGNATDGAAADGSVQSVIDKAYSMLAENPGKAIEMLTQAKEKGTPDAAEAALALSRIFRLEALMDSQKAAVARHIGNDTEEQQAANKAVATQHVMDAFSFAKSNPRVLLEMGNIYYGGPSYTGGNVQRDLDKAVSFYRKAVEKAKEQGDNNSRLTAENYLRELEAAGVAVSAEAAAPAEAAPAEAAPAEAPAAKK